ncbi:MAG: amidohydrolase [Lachnospiraceae bacterium]|nr:amidohydrolase [Lachnospiraceae bacterium]
MRIRFYNAKILTMEEGRKVFAGELWTDGDRISKVVEGAAAEEKLRGISWDREIDCQGNLLMPGFKDVHTHSSMTFLRSYADDLPLQEWLTTKIFPMEARLDEESIYHFGRLAVLEYLTSGITGICDMYVNLKAVARACIDTGMRCRLVSGLNDFTSSLKQMEEEYDTYSRANSLLRYQVGFHAEYTCSKALLQSVSELAHDRKVSVFTHLSETKREVAQCVEKYGMTPAMFLDSLGLYDFGGGGYHCIYLTEEEKELFRQRDLTVVTNPASNLKLASGIAPVADYLRRGIQVAIGTDGPASNNCLDFFREMFLVSGLAKATEEDPTACPADMVLKMATLNGADIMGFQGLGALTEGNLADLIMIDLSQPNMRPLHDVVNNLVYSGSKSNVKMTMIGGKILYENGSFTGGIDPEEIYRECEKAFMRIRL